MWFSKFWGVRGLEYFLEFQGVTPPWKFQALQVVNIDVVQVGQDMTRTYSVDVLDLTFPSCSCFLTIFLHFSPTEVSVDSVWILNDPHLPVTSRPATSCGLQ